MSSDSSSAGAASPPGGQTRIAGLILAAGKSSRMGKDKPLLKYRGRTFLETLISTLHEAGIERVVVVLGHHAAAIRLAADLSSVDVAVNHDYHLGQTSSLKAGLRALGRNEPDAIIICLVDHPAVSAATVRQLVARFSSTGKPVVVPQIDGKHGHPVLVGRELFAKIRALGPNEGADRVVRNHRDRTEFVTVSDPGILLDIDDLEAYRRLIGTAAAP